MRTSRIRCIVMLAVLSAISPLPQARAAEAEVHSELDVQLYDVMNPYDEAAVRRRRYTHTLGLDVSDIDGAQDYLAPELVFRSRLRLDADFGQTSGERDPENLGRYVPGLDQAPFDLMYAFLEGRHYADGALGFRVGRQYQVDALGWWSFDGALLRLDAPSVLGIEVYGGFEQRGGLPMLGTSRYESDGVMRGNRGALEQHEWPVFLEQKRLAPAYGASVQSLGLDGIQARLSYRKVVNRDRVLASPFPDANGAFTFVDENRTSSERAAASLAVPWDGVGALNSELVYDLFLRKPSDATLALDWFVSEASTLGVSYEYYLPTFDGDSIFNWFSHGATESIQLSARGAATRRLDVAGRGGVRLFRVAGDVDPVESGSAPGLDYFVFGNARYQLPAGEVGLDSEAQWGDSGHRLGGNLTTNRRFHEGYYDALVIVSLYDFSDALRPERSALSGGYVLGAGVAPEIVGIVRSRLGVEWEHMMSELYAHQFRVLVTFSLAELP